MILVEKISYRLYGEDETFLRVSKEGEILYVCDFEHELESWLSKNVLPDEYVDYNFY